MTSIGNEAFANCIALTVINFNAIAMDNLSSSNYVFYCAGQSGDGITVTIGANVTKIPAYLFDSYYKSGYNYSPKITNVVFKDNSICESIGDFAFFTCTSLKGIPIPDSVTSIGICAFHDCRSLTSVYYSGTASQWASISFKNASANPLYYAGNLYLNGILATDITLEGITAISVFAFTSCRSLTSVTIGSGVTSIGSDAFCGCYKLVEVYNLSSLSITAGSPDNGLVGYNAKNIYTSESNKSNFIMQSGYIFYNDNGTYYLMGYTANDTELNLPAFTVNGETVNYSIYQYAFYNKTEITSITIPDGVTSIGSRAFSGCTSLENITIPASVTTIGDDAFNFRKPLTNVFYSGTASQWASISFCNYFSNPVFFAGNLYLNGTIVTDITIEGITAINKYAFRECTSLTSVIIHDGVTSIDGVFYACPSLKSVIIPDSVISIGDFTFFECSALESVTIPDSVTSIGDHAFENCTALKKIIIGSGVKTIKGSIFLWCEKLSGIYYHGNKEEWNKIAIDEMNESLLQAKKYYYSDNQPDCTDNENYWHYGENGEVMVWGEETLNSD